MNAVLMVDEGVRLYSKQSRLPVDVIADQHREIHADLERWGAWNRGGGGGPDTACSIEGRFDPSAGREVKRPVISLPPNPMHMHIHRAVGQMPMQHADTIRRYYIRRQAPEHICRAIIIRFRDFPRWMFDCRAMVINLLRRDGVVRVSRHATSWGADGI